MRRVYMAGPRPNDNTPHMVKWWRKHAKLSYQNAKETEELERQGIPVIFSSHHLRKTGDHYTMLANVASMFSRP